MNTGYKETDTKVPAWLLQKNTSVGLNRNKKGRTHYILKTMKELSRVMQNDILSERSAAFKGVLQQIDPRVKLITLLAYIVFAGTAQSVMSFIFLTAIALVLVKLSGLSVFAYIKRVWMLLPLIFFIFSIPGATNVFVPGRPVIYLYRDAGLFWGEGGLYFTQEGIMAITRMFLRLGISISFGYLLMMTTRWTYITKALRLFHIPQLVISILDMTYRYIFVLSKTAIAMFEARYLRTVGRVRNRDARRLTSNHMAHLFVKAHKISEDVYDCMLCRGYTGEPVSLKEFKLRVSDIIWSMNQGILFLILVLGEYYFG